MENSIILIIDFFSRNSTEGEKEWKNSRKKSSGVGGWRGGLRKKYDFCTHISSRWKMKVLLSPFIIFHAWNFAGLLSSSRQTRKRWKSVSRSTVYLCMAIHSLLLQGKPYYYSKSSYLLKKTDDEKELPSFDALLHLFHPFSPQLPSVPIGLFAPRGMKIPSYCFLTYAHQIIFLSENGDLPY